MMKSMNLRGLVLLWAASTLALLSAPAAEARLLAFVPILFEERLSVIDPATDTVVDSVPLGIRPFGVALNPQRGRIYAWGQPAGSPDHFVEVVDATTFTVVDSVPVPPAILTVEASPSGDRFYIATANDAIWAMRSSDNGFITSIRGAELNSALGLAFSPDGSLLYASNYMNSGSAPVAAVIDLATNTIVGSLTDGGAPATDIVVDSSGTTAYLARLFNEVTVFDLVSGVVTNRIPAANRSDALAISPDGLSLYLSSTNDNSVYFIDAVTETVIDSTLSGSGPEAIAVHPDGSRIYVVNLGSTFVSVFDTATRERIQQITVGQTGVPFRADFLGDFVEPPPEIFADGFESGDFSAWSGTVGDLDPTMPPASVPL